MYPIQMVCPRGAIFETVKAVSLRDLKDTFEDLGEQIDKIVQSIERLEENKN